MSDIGIKLNIDGEKSFNSALKEINSGLKLLGSEMKAVSSSFLENNKSIEATAAKNQVLNKQIEAQKEKVDFLRQTLQQATDAYGENDRRTQAWATKLNIAEAELNKMQSQLKSGNTELEKYGSFSEKTSEYVGKLDNEISTLKGALDEVDKKYKGNTNSVEALNEKQDILNNILEKQSEKVNTLKETVETSKNAYGETGEETKKWEQALNSAEKELNGTQQELKNVDNQMQASTKTTSTFGDTLKAVLAANVIQSGIKMLGNSIKSVGSYMSSAITGAASFGKEISLMSEKTGISTENLQKFQAAARVTGVDVDTFTNTLSRSIRSMNSASSGSGAISEAYKQLGVAVTDSNGELRNSEEVYWDTIDALKNMNNETQRDAYTMQIFGKSALELNPIIKRGSESFREITNSVVTFDEQTIETMRGLDISIGKLGSVMDGVKRAVGASFAPAMSEMAEAASNVGSAFRNIFMTIATGGDMNTATDKLVSTVNSMVSVLQEAVPKFMETAGSMISALATGISAALPLIVNAIVPMIPGIVQALMNGVNQLIPVAIDIVMALVNGIISALPAIISGATQMITALVSGISKSLPVLVPAAISIVMEIVGALLNNIDLIFDAAIDLLMALVDAIPPTIDALLNALPNLIEKFITALVNNFDKIMQGAIKLFNAIIEAIPKIIVMLVNKLPDIIQSIISTLTKPETITTLVSAAFQMFMALVTAIPKITIEIVKSLPQIINGVIKAIGAWYGSMADAGANLVKGLWQGISNMTQWIKDKIFSFAKGITESIKSFFGIHSPSTLFENVIGKNLALGLGEGFSNEMNTVAKQMQEAIPTNFDIEPVINNGYLNAVESPTADNIINNSDNLISAFQQALNGMGLYFDGDKMGEMIINKVEKVVYA